MTTHCQGIYSEDDFDILSHNTNLDYEDVMVLLDPSTWILRHLDLEPYWYQDIALKCTSTRKAYRWGRRTGKTHIVAADFIRQCFLYAGMKILAVTPYKSQAREIRERVIEFLDENPNVRAELEGAVQQPYYEFKFKNGSRIRIFVGGSSGGANAGAQVRGQEADLIFMDEMDYLDDDAAGAISPILTDPSRQGGEVKIIISSTPSGKEGLFYDMCTDDHYHELHIPSRFRPDWNKRRDADARRNAKTQQNYDHEYEANWGTKSDGVFRRNDIIRAMKPYRYHDYDGIHEEVKWDQMSPWAHWTYMMGVDWNGPGNGTRIAIVGYDPKNGKWCVVYREAIAVEEFAFHVAVERMVQLNRTWKCHSIYIDEGYGGMQDESLQKIGLAALAKKQSGDQYHTADLTFVENCKPVDFGSSLKYKVTDPDTKQLVEKKKPLKNYMVENLQRHFELDSIWFSKADHDLKQQFMGYHSPRQGKHNELIYKADPEAGDHDLDAVMLAIYAFNKEFDPVFAKNYISHVETAPRPGQEKVDNQAPNPYTHPAQYEKWLEDRKQGKQEPGNRVMNIPSRKVQQPEKKKELRPGEEIFVVPTHAPRKIARQFSNPPSRNQWRRTTPAAARSIHRGRSI